MATVKVKFRSSSVREKEGALYFQIIHHRVVRTLKTGCKIYPEEWNSSRAEVIVPAETALRYHYLSTVKEQLTELHLYLKRIIMRLERAAQPYTCDRIVELYATSASHDGLLSFTRNVLHQLEEIGKELTSITYVATLNSFSRFRKEKDIPLEEVDSELMVAYEAYLKSVGVCQNTSSFYMRNLRAIYNRAVEKGIIVQAYPFRHVYTGIDKTVKRAVPVEVIRRIRDLCLEQFPSLDYARDLFMFSFYTRGMSFIDMAYLKKKDLQNGVLSYRRQKTRQQLFIKWEEPMQDIVDKYDTTGTPYLLPIIKDTGQDERRQYKNASHLVNQKLKIIGEQLGLSIPLTTYVARHGWASIAKSKNIPLATISEAMGHDSESTTRIYLASLDTSVVDKANKLILESL